jgi:hypothetical protein
MDHVYYMLTAMILGAVSSPADNLYNLLPVLGKHIEREELAAVEVHTVRLKKPALLSVWTPLLLPV